MPASSATRPSSGSSSTAPSFQVKIDRKATAISLLVAIGVRRDGQKVLLALRSMGGESTAAWSAFLEDMTRRGLRAPGFVIIDGAPGLEAALWPDVPVQRCTQGPLKKAAAVSGIRGDAPHGDLGFAMHLMAPGRPLRRGRARSGARGGRRSGRGGLRRAA